MREPDRAAAGRRAAAVIWIEDAVPRATVIQLLSHATVFVCPSVYEPLRDRQPGGDGLRVRRWSPPPGGIPEIVVDGETGYLVPGAVEAGGAGAPSALGFEAALAGRINELVADPVLAGDMGRAGRRRVLERFSWEVVASQTIDLYKSLITRAAP